MIVLMSRHLLSSLLASFIAPPIDTPRAIEAKMIAAPTIASNSAYSAELAAASSMVILRRDRIIFMKFGAAGPGARRSHPA